ncbi:MAG: hypothetical protein M1827_004565 [Pycnora praestabilis]|nr:MAG: hypothetical protein M1827_004565 [Pycnora praestabilis]
MVGSSSTEFLALDVSGQPFTISKSLAGKYPFSRLADLFYQDAPSGRHYLAVDPNAFDTLLNFLRHSELRYSPAVTTNLLEQTFDTLEVPLPTSLFQQYTQMETQMMSEKSMIPASENESDPVPSYEESTHLEAISSPSKVEKTSVTQASVGNSNEPQPMLPARLASTREHRIQLLIDVYIQPLIDEQGLSGLYKRTCALVPSNITSLQRISSVVPDVIEGIGPEHNGGNGGDEVIGFPEDEYVKLVRLHGDENSMEFWRQPAVVAELETSLKARLYAAGHRLIEQPSPPPNVPVAAQSPPSTQSRGFFSRRKESRSTEESKGTTPSDVASGWRAPEQMHLQPGQVSVKTELEDISLRVVSDMGLFETKSGKALVVRIEVGS